MATETKNTKAFYNTEIPEGWKVLRLGDICSHFKSGYGITSEFISYEGEFPVYGGNGLRGFSKNFTHEGDYLLIGRQGALCGNILLVSGKNYISEHAIAVQTNDKNDLNFLGYKLEFKNLNRLSESSAQPGLSVEKLVRLKLDIPPLTEQKAIAQVLSTVDAAIHTTEKLIDQKELRKKWLMQQLLTGKKRLNGFEGEWKEMQLGDMFTERIETKYFDLPLLSIGQNGVYPQNESVKKDTSNEDKSKYKRICPGDIGYNTMRMWQGRSALSGLEGIVSPAYTIVTPKKNSDSIFFSYLFKMPKMTNLFWRNSQGLVDDTLNCKFKDFSIVKTMLPPKREEQAAIAQLLQAADKEISLLKAKAAKLREQKKGLMQVLLTGKVRLQIDSE
jgi:type I restriction enzyme S subunit